MPAQLDGDDGGRACSPTSTTAPAACTTMAAINRAAHAAGRARRLGPGALGRRAAGRPDGDGCGRRRRLRGRLRLQVPERRAGRAGVRLGPSAAHAPMDARCRPAAVGLARATRRRSSSRPTTGPPRASRASSAARRRSCRWPRSNAASTRCSPPSWRHRGAAREVDGADRPLHRAGRARCAGHGLALRDAARAAARGSQVSFAHAKAPTPSCRR